MSGLMVSPAGHRPRPSPERLRAELARRLEARLPEIEEAILARAHAVADPSGEDAEYRQGLRAAIAAAIDFGLAGIERGDERAGPVPVAMLAQARHAARNGIGLDTVLRRYVAGYTALGDFFMQEARDGRLEVDGAALYRAQKELAALFDRIVAAVTAEYGRESERARSPRAERLAERVRRLLAGELVDTSELAYDFEGWHIGVIASGPGVEQALRRLAGPLDCRLLLVSVGEETVWAWLGARRKLEATELDGTPPPDISLATGEPARGERGWRLTHQQAQAACTIALRRPPALTRYADVALRVAILRDDTLIGFLTDAYLKPLFAARDRGDAMRRTLRAYFAAERNASSTAAALGVSRQTVNNRLHAIEEHLGRRLATCASELEAALWLAELTTLPASTAPHTAGPYCAD